MSEMFRRHLYLKFVSNLKQFNEKLISFGALIRFSESNKKAQFKIKKASGESSFSNRRWKTSTPALRISRGAERSTLVSSASGSGSRSEIAINSHMITTGGPQPVPGWRRLCQWETPMRRAALNQWGSVFSNPQNRTCQLSTVFQRYGSRDVACKLSTWSNVTNDDHANCRRYVRRILTREMPRLQSLHEKPSKKF